MLESYHFFITLRFHDSGNQESYVSFGKILLILVIIYIFFVQSAYKVSGFIIQIKPATNLNLIAYNKPYYVNFI